MIIKLILVALGALAIGASYALGTFGISHSHVLATSASAFCAYISVTCMQGLIQCIQIERQ